MSKYRVETNVPEAEPKFDVSNRVTEIRKIISFFSIICLT